jgi:hypothetical protein
MALLFAEGTWEATSLAVVVVMVIAGYVVTYFLSQRALKQAIAELRREFDQRLIAAQAKAVPAPAAVVAPPVTASAIAQPVAAKPVEAPREEVTPETLLILAAAVTAFLGKKVRSRSAKMLYAHESFNAWSQQGRVVVQASHNLAQRGY